MGDKELYEKFCAYGRAALEARNKCIGLLPEIYKRRIYVEKGFSSIYEFAAKLAGLSQEQVNRVLNLEKRFADKPVLHEALVKGEVGVNKLRKVVSIVTVQNQEEILESVKALSVRAVETMVRDHKNLLTENCRSQINIFGDGHVTTQETMFRKESQISDEVRGGSELQLDATVEQELLAMQRKGIDLNDLLKKFLLDYREELEEEKDQIAEELPDDAGRYVPVSVKNVLKKEFGNCCSVPGCNRPFYEIHHLLPYALVRKHDPRLMVQLCREHHEITHVIDRKSWFYRNWKAASTIFTPVPGFQG